jgi:transketolase
VFAHAEARKWAAVQIDGHHIQSIDRTCSDTVSVRDRPTMILARDNQGSAPPRGPTRRASTASRRGIPAIAAAAPRQVEFGPQLRTVANAATG